MGIPTVVFSGSDGRQALYRVDFYVIAIGHVTSSVQELHIVLAHMLCEYAEKSMFGEES